MEFEFSGWNWNLTGNKSLIDEEEAEQNHTPEYFSGDKENIVKTPTQLQLSLTFTEVEFDIYPPNPLGQPCPILQTKTVLDQHFFYQNLF